MASTSSINNFSTTRMLGLSSGIDTESLITTMLQYEKSKVDRQMKNKLLQEWKQEALTSVNDDLRNFRNTHMSVLSPDNLLSASAFDIFNVAMSGTDKDAVTITAGPGATNGTITIDYIAQLASGAKAESSARVSRGDQLSDNNNVALSQLGFANSLGAVNGKISFSINGEVFDFSTSDTLQTVLNTVNNNVNAGVTMKYSRLTDTFSIETDVTGEYLPNGSYNSLVIKNVTGSFFGTEGATGIAAGAYVNGKHAVLSVNGHQVIRSSNNFTVDGITYNLNETFNLAMDPNSSVKATMTRDIDSVVEKVKGFVTAYNELYSKLYTMVTERKKASERDYLPLTDDEKSLLTEDQVKQWEDIAKKGLLANDSGIKSVLSQMRSALYEKVESAGLSPADIGLRIPTYTPSGGLTTGQIELDEDVLRSALERDPNGVMQVFTAFAPEDADASTTYRENGFLNRLIDIISDYGTHSNSLSIQTTNRIISNLDDKIEQLEERMAELEERYYAKFAAMEAFLTQLQSQSASITSLLGLPTS